MKFVAKEALEPRLVKMSVILLFVQAMLSVLLMTTEAIVSVVEDTEAILITGKDVAKL